jgi:hypothetical protein
MRWLTPRRQMTYAQWLEQSRKQAAEREAEPLSAVPDCESTDSDPEEIEAGISTQKIEAIEPTNSTPEAAPDDPPSVKEDPTWLPAVEYFEAGHSFAIGDIGIDAFTTPHDAADPVGFVFRSEGIRLGFATDLGYVTPNIKAQLRALDLLLIESNHDLEMLRDGPYPWSVKQRVLSRVGHLSNDATAEFLLNGYDGQAAYVVLAHLSENNNLPELARVAAERALIGRASLLANRLLLAEQHKPLVPIAF